MKVHLCVVGHSLSEAINDFQIKFQKQIDKNKINAKTQVGQKKTEHPPPPHQILFSFPRTVSLSSQSNQSNQFKPS